MAGCDANNIGGDNDAGVKRVESWGGLGALIGGIVGIIFGGLPGAAAGAAAGLVVGLGVGQAIAWFSRLKEHNPKTITIGGTVACAGRNPFGFQPWTDGDWTFNIGDIALLLPTDLAITVAGANTQEDEIRLRVAPGAEAAFKSFNEADCSPSNIAACKTDILHCEISSRQGGYAVVGGAIGSVVGAAAGIGAAAAACAALGIFTFGIGALVCLLVAAVVAALASAAGTAVGDAVGAVVGRIADEASDFDKLGKTIQALQDCTISLTGTWVTDRSHQHNEIHDIESMQVLFCYSRGDRTSSRASSAGIAAIGRRPTGGDTDIR
jgi:hypothetical protein